MIGIEVAESWQSSGMDPTRPTQLEQQQQAESQAAAVTTMMMTMVERRRRELKHEEEEQEQQEQQLFRLELGAAVWAFSGAGAAGSFNG